ncbi:MAG: DUF2179 domain-containing protein [Calditrichaeota bacterium]|nr:DUF2179 domain-containing protein [Calditrichota bacterium]
MNEGLVNWVLLPLLIFLARIMDVSIGTMRIIFVSRGRREISAVLGFFEVLIWLIAIRQIFNNLDNPACFLGYALGFATGNYIGMFIENKLAIGIQVVRIITRRDATPLINRFRKLGFGVTIVHGEGARGHVKLIFMVVPRKEIAQIVHDIQSFNPKAFFSIEDIRSAEEGIFPNNPGDRFFTRVWRRLKWEKKK